MPDRVFIASPEIKEQPKADESEETGGQCRVFVAVSGFDRQAARPMRRGHCHVIPFWTAELGKKEWHAFQVSPRTGILYCRMENDRVFMRGKAALYFIASLFLPDGSVTG